MPGQIEELFLSGTIEAAYISGVFTPYTGKDKARTFPAMTIDSLIVGVTKVTSVVYTAPVTQALALTIDAIMVAAVGSTAIVAEAPVTEGPALDLDAVVPGITYSTVIA